ncbi:MAG: division/cell wall cluster transcriptional repressor MraZ [Thermoguttaceae bacterium]
MSDAAPLILGEFTRKLDERFRLSLPNELLELFQPQDGGCVVAKERSGCLSLWDRNVWQSRLDDRVALVQQRMKLGDLQQRVPELQTFGRLLSTRHRPVELEERGRLLLPEGFRDFLEVPAKGEVIVVGAMVCVEIWNPKRWFEFVNQDITRFSELLDTLSH